MNIIFDGNYLLRKTLSALNTYENTNFLEELSKPEKQAVFIRKVAMDFCHTINLVKTMKVVILTLDSHPNWRKVAYQDYKGNRVTETDYTLFHNMVTAFAKVCTDAGIIVSKLAPFEADDLCYFWSQYFEKSLNQNSIIVSGDYDLAQLVSPNTYVFNNNSKFRHFYHHPNLEEFDFLSNDYDFNFTPLNFRDVILEKVLLGDKGDNIPNVCKGFGDKKFQVVRNNVFIALPEFDVFHAEFQTYIAESVNTAVKGDIKVILMNIIRNLQLTVLDWKNYKDEHLDLFFIHLIALKDGYAYRREYKMQTLLKDTPYVN